ncbi:hypothetical protein mRhiFer1_008345 [Rhinolophus ferrumequinum]|uniref:Uncharacterized protein n=1 Tax=Rhinolophus ferrumequinum TaxID=59479 RepID=A0A7J7VE05_RHIFE|nr:hypothetical protein mRhiFer1_008345 [Rhinolophus ferrumequinum]
MMTQTGRGRVRNTIQTSPSPGFHHHHIILPFPLEQVKNKSQTMRSDRTSDPGEKMHLDRRFFKASRRRYMLAIEMTKTHFQIKSSAILSKREWRGPSLHSLADLHLSPVFINYQLRDPGHLVELL